MLHATIQNLGNVAVIHCTGTFTAGDGAELRSAVLAQIAARKIVLDLAGISAIDDSGIGTLVALRVLALASGKRFRLMNLRPQVKEILELEPNTRFEVCSVQEMIGLICCAIESSRVPGGVSAQPTSGSEIHWTAVSSAA